MVQVTYQGGGMDGVTSNAASEATLQLLLKAISGQGGNTGGAQGAFDGANAKGLIGAQKQQTKATKGATSATQDYTKSTNFAKDAVKKMGQMASRVGGMLVGGLTNVGATVGSLGKELLMGGNRLSDFSQHVTGLISTVPLLGPVLGGAIQSLVNFIDMSIDSFRQVSDAGIDFGGGLFEIQKQATQTSFNLETFAGALADGSNNLAALFGGASAGARAFTDLQKELKPSIKNLNALGVSNEQVAEFTNDYLELQKMRGGVEGRTSRQLAQGTTDYIQQLDRLSKITGMTRKQAAEALREQMADKRIQALMAAVDPKVRENMEGTFVALGNVGPAFKDGIMELVATGGVPMSEMGESIAAMMPEVVQATKDLKSGAIDQDEFTRILQASQKKAQERLKEEGVNIATQKQMGVTLFDSVLDLAKAGKIAGQDSEARQQQLEAQQNIQRALLNFEQVIQDIRNKIYNRLIESGLFDKFSELMGKLQTKFTQFMDSKGLDLIETYVDKLVDYIGRFIDDLGKLNFNEMLTKYLIDPIKGLFGFKKSGGDSSAGIDGPGGEAQGDVKAGFLQPIVDAFKDFAKYLVIGGVGLAVILGGIGVALGLLAAPAAAASPGLLAIGAAFAGIGVAAGGIAMLIEAITSSVGNLADGAKKFEELDADQLKLVGGGLKELTGPIMDLAKGGIVANFVGSGAFENLANGIREFENVDPTKLHAVGPALVSLHKGMSAFTGDGVLDSIGKALGSLFGGSSGSISDLADDVKEFADVDAQGLKAIGEGLQGIANFIESMDGANLRNVSKSLTELTKQLGDYQAQYSKLDSEAKANLVSNFSSFGEGQKGAADKLDQLNTSVNQMLAELRKIASTSRDTADNLV
tara:strand:- start:8011 stop:10617 length:2607 start_codon:yes stop_codon:yes gene_type:complete